MTTPLSPEEKKRYDRQLILPEIGQKGQNILKHSRILVAGLGGLGSVSAFYMAAAGIGHLNIVDMDVVEIGNLNRQILHGTRDIDRPKARSAFETLKDLNPDCHITAFEKEIAEETIDELGENVDLILDGTDNMETRRILNRFSLKKKTPYIYGGIDGFYGMVATFLPGETPCLECLFPRGISKNRPAEKKKKIGAIGPVPGMVASIQSMEAVKQLLGIKESALKNRLLYIDARTMSFEKIKIEKNPNCPACGEPRGR